MNRALNSGLIMALCASLLFSLKPVLIKQAYLWGADSESLMLLRMLYAAPFYLLILWIFRSGLPGKSRALPMVVAAGFLGYFLASYLDLLALEQVSAQAERIILYAYPSIVVLIRCLLTRSMPGKHILLALGCAYAGILVLIPGELNLQGTGTGLFIVFASALSFAIYVVISGDLIKQFGSMLFTAVSMLIATLFTQIHWVTTTPAELQNLPAQVHGYALGIAFFCTVLPSFAMARAINLLGAEKTAISGATGPVFTTLLAIVLLGEAVTLFHMLGMLLVVGGVLIMQRAKKSA
ncbi:MAG: DMT family transporter [Oceanospirillaceae bacterium]|nr:DMT family transporter [Oceanospirillaceae bacterium]MCP5334587.1 DMT family transporter [Oceanospirillaceae bacterium]MCP5351379.1 DMT family transporter [Oceanospirillaceae bacterium]